ncbi:substrate-binding domain-containing protein [Akkermansiaceae bacterium]|nr:substrate-binding domain-containing protein [Akkermansiaceae bacterium]
MGRLVITTAAEQVAWHLRAEILAGLRRGKMPGGDKLAAELGIGCNTAEAALDLLERQGLLLSRGSRRGRLIAEIPASVKNRSLRVAILTSESVDRGIDYMIEIEHELAGRPHTVIQVARGMVELGMDLRRISSLVEQTEADAWLVLAAPQDVMEWFAARGTPCFAIFGRRQGLPVAGAGPDKRAALLEATRRLAGLGHRRIVLFARPRRRLPTPGLSEQAFLDELEALGLPVGNYNLPAWEERPEGFHARLDSLFRVTPPTALIIQEAPSFLATQQFLSMRRISVPGDVSLVCTDHSPVFDWCRPLVSHIRWESRPLVNRVLKWASNVASGKADRQQLEIAAKFVEGGTIGPTAKRQ